MPLVFTYGPDALQGRMFDRIGPSEFLGPAVLGGYALVFDKPNLKAKEEGLANLRVAPEGRVLGSLFELTSKQLEQLEGFFGGYERKSVEVLVRDPEGAEEKRSATTWLARRTKAGLTPSPVTLALTQKGLEENGAEPGFFEAIGNLEVKG